MPDKLPTPDDGSGSSVHALKIENQRLRAEIDQWEVQLAGCLTAAEGWAGNNPPKPGDWAWSPAFQAVLSLRSDYDYVKKIDALRAGLESAARLRLCEELSAIWLWLKKIAADLQDADALGAATPGPRKKE